MPQQVRSVTEPPIREDLLQQSAQGPFSSSNVSSPVSQTAVGPEQGSVQIPADVEDDTSSVQQQYTPIQAQAPSEVVQQPVSQAIAAEAPQEGAAELLRPSNPEIVIHPEIEHVVEKMPSSVAADTSLVPKDVVSQYVKPEGAGVPVPQNDFGIKTLPLSYMQADELEKRSDIKNGSHWFADKVKYLWEKLNPTLWK